MLGGWLGIPLQILASIRQQIESWFILKVRMKVIALVSMIWVFGESEGLLQYYADHYLADAILRSTATMLSVLSHPLQFAGSAIVLFRPRLRLALAASLLFILLTPNPLARAAEIADIRYRYQIPISDLGVIGEGETNRQTLEGYRDATGAPSESGNVRAHGQKIRWTMALVAGFVATTYTLSGGWTGIAFFAAGAVVMIVDQTTKAIVRARVPRMSDEQMRKMLRSPVKIAIVHDAAPVLHLSVLFPNVLFLSFLSVMTWVFEFHGVSSVGAGMAWGAGLSHGLEALWLGEVTDWLYLRQSKKSVQTTNLADLSISVSIPLILSQFRLIGIVAGVLISLTMQFGIPLPRSGKAQASQSDDERGAVQAHAELPPSEGRKGSEAGSTHDDQSDVQEAIQRLRGQLIAVPSSTFGFVRSQHQPFNEQVFGDRRRSIRITGESI